MNTEKDQAAELFRAMDRVRRAWHGVIPCKTLSKSQFGTLLSIFHHGMAAEKDGKNGVISMSALAAAMNQSVPALSQRVRGLEDMGYVERVPDPADRRVIGVRLTPEGTEMLKKAREHFNGILSKALEEMGPDLSGQLVSLLSELAMSLEHAVADCEESEKPC